MTDLVSLALQTTVITAEEVLIEDLEWEREVFREAFISYIISAALKHIDDSEH